MSKKGIGVLSALSLVFSQAGVESTAQVQEAEDFETRCGKYQAMESRAELQNELELLLASAPSDDCIPVIVSILGSPLARVGDDPGVPFDSEPTPPSGPTGGITPTSY